MELRPLSFGEGLGVRSYLFLCHTPFKIYICLFNKPCL
jgi:hypothetical protein